MINQDCPLKNLKLRFNKEHDVINLPKIHSTRINSYLKSMIKEEVKKILNFKDDKNKNRVL